MRTFVIGDVHGRREQLRRLIEIVPRNPATDTLVMLGDLIDRGEDVPGVVADVMALQQSVKSGDAPVIVLRGNHEQMLLDFIDTGADLWMHPAVGGTSSWEQYTGRELFINTEEDLASARAEIERAVPAAHVEFFRGLPLYHEDRYAIYVHAGLDGDTHPRDASPRQLLWSRDPNFFKHYHGKTCVFGHTPTPLLPLLGRLGRHGIYVSHSAVGIDTGYASNCALTCLQLPEFIIYQTFADGRTSTHHINAFVPEPLRVFRREAAAR